MHWRFAIAELDLLDRLAETLGHGERRFGAGVGEEHSEFLAADAPEEVARAQHLDGALGEDLEHAVADMMAVPVIDALEMIEIDEEQCDR